MSKLTASLTAASLFLAASLPAFAAQHKSAEDTCKGLAKKEHISADKMDAFMKTCVEKHTKHTHTQSHSATKPSTTATEPAPAAGSTSGGAATEGTSTK